MTVKLPALPDDDSDFTPDLARKLIAKYQEFLADVLAENEQLVEIHVVLRRALHEIAYAPPDVGHGPTLSESIQIARKALGE